MHAKSFVCGICCIHRIIQLYRFLFRLVLYSDEDWTIWIIMWQWYWRLSVIWISNSSVHTIAFKKLTASIPKNHLWHLQECLTICYLFRHQYPILKYAYNGRSRNSHTSRDFEETQTKISCPHIMSFIKIFNLVVSLYMHGYSIE